MVSQDLQAFNRTSDDQDKHSFLGLNGMESCVAVAARRRASSVRSDSGDFVEMTTALKPPTGIEVGDYRLE